MTITRMRGLVLGVLLASCAALPAAAQAQASAPALSTTTKCLDPHSTVDQFVDVTATGLVPGSSYYPLLDLTSGNDGDVEVGYGVGNIDADADGNGVGDVWFDTATYAANTTGDDPDLYLKLRLNADWGLAA